MMHGALLEAAGGASTDAGEFRRTIYDRRLLAGRACCASRRAGTPAAQRRGGRSAAAFARRRAGARGPPPPPPRRHLQQRAGGRYPPGRPPRPPRSPRCPPAREHSLATSRSAPRAGHDRRWRRRGITRPMARAPHPARRCCAFHGACCAHAVTLAARHRLQKVGLRAGERHATGAQRSSECYFLLSCFCRFTP